MLNRGKEGGYFPVEAEPLPAYPLGSGALQLSAGDFDGDTWPDLVAIGAGSAMPMKPGVMQVFRNTTPR